MEAEGGERKAGKVVHHMTRDEAMREVERAIRECFGPEKVEAIEMALCDSIVEVIFDQTRGVSVRGGNEGQYVQIFSRTHGRGKASLLKLMARLTARQSIVADAAAGYLLDMVKEAVPDRPKENP